MSIDFGLMLVHWYWVKVVCIGIGLMLYVSALD